MITMTLTRLYCPLFSVGAILLGIGSFLLLINYGIKPSMPDIVIEYVAPSVFHYSDLWLHLSCLGFWCIIWAFFIDIFIDYMRERDIGRQLKKMF